MFKSLMRLWLNRSTRYTDRTRSRRALRKQYFRPRFEVLEDRLTPSHYSVTALTDTNSGSGNSGDLLYCLNQANNNGSTSSNTITFEVSGEITLASTLPEIDNNLTINGPSSGSAILNGNGLG